MKLVPEEPSAAPWQLVQIDALINLIYSVRSTNRPWIVAIDGRSGSGKSTIAKMIHHAVPNSAVVHTDDVAWHHSFFDWGELLLDGILKPLHAGKSVSYQPPGWQPNGRSGAIEVQAGLPLVIVEGVGASRNEIASWIDASIWVQSDMDEAERRGIARDGDTEEAIRFWHEWMAQEIRFLQRHRPWERATVITNGTPTQSYDQNREVVVSAHAASGESS